MLRKTARHHSMRRPQRRLKYKNRTQNAIKARKNTVKAANDTPTVRAVEVEKKSPSVNLVKGRRDERADMKLRRFQQQKAKKLIPKAG